MREGGEEESGYMELSRDGVTINSTSLCELEPINQLKRSTAESMRNTEGRLLSPPLLYLW